MNTLNYESSKLGLEELFDNIPYEFNGYRFLLIKTLKGEYRVGYWQTMIASAIKPDNECCVVSKDLTEALGQLLIEINKQKK